MKRNRNDNEKNIWRKVGIILFWIGVWQLLALWVDNEILFVSPWKVLYRFSELLVTLQFWQTILHSVGRIVSGFLLGTVLGLVLAVLATKNALLEDLLKPVILLCKTVPVASFVVLLLIWWGSEYLAVAISFLIVLPNIYISTLEGIHGTDKKLLEMAGVFDIPVRNRFFYIYRPALKPFLNSSIRLSLGMCWKSGVAAEVIGTPEFSIGERMYFSKIHLDTAGVFAWTAVIILVSICFERFFLWLLDKFFAWEPVCRKAAGGKRKWGTEERAAQGELTVQNLSKSFGDLQLFQDYNAVYKAGETYYFTEPSGSGKTTFFRILCGLEKADKGAVWPQFSYSFCFQEDRLCEEYSALRNVEMITGDRAGARDALNRLLEDEAIMKPGSQLSGGMKRRVALVRAMEAESDVVILDEPFTGMDPETRARVEQYIKERKRGRIILIATHI